MIGLDPHAYFYEASAYLKLNRLAEAEKSALRQEMCASLKILFVDLHLLAQIYEVEGDSAQELQQLRQYLKVVSDPQDAAMLKKYVGPLRDFYVALVAKGMKPEMARLTLARKIAAIALTLWKKEERFDTEQLKPQAA